MQVQLVFMMGIEDRPVAGSVAELIVSEVARFAYLTSQHRDDLLKLRLDQISNEGIMIVQSKTGARILIESDSKIKAMCARLALIASPDTRHVLNLQPVKAAFTDSGFKAMWGRLMVDWKESGNNLFYFHDLRAKAITKMIDDGKNTKDLYCLSE